MRGESFRALRGCERTFTRSGLPDMILKVYAGAVFGNDDGCDKALGLLSAAAIAKIKLQGSDVGTHFRRWTPLCPAAH